MPSFQDSALLVILALILFGPKRLPELARQLGKLMAEFRRASNEFRIQMEDELRIAEQEEQKKKIAAMQAAAPATPALPEHPSVHSEITPEAAAVAETSAETAETTEKEEPFKTYRPEPEFPEDDHVYDSYRHPLDVSACDPAAAYVEDAAEPLPIAESGGLKMMPPATGLPVGSSAISTVLESIPNDPEPAETTANEVPYHG